MQQSSAYFSVLPKPFDQKPASERGRRFRRRAAAMAGAAAMACFVSPAMAESEPKTKLVRCGTHSCLQISGHRDDPASIVSLNGHTVSAEGRNGWRVRLPVETVRRWSAPHARTIEVSLRDPETDQETSVSADLPIGLLGDVTSLASLEIRAL